MNFDIITSGDLHGHYSQRYVFIDISTMLDTTKVIL